MTLRTRLILAFLLLSVVPLGIVTFYSYRSNVDAMHEVAAREADLLSAVLNQRMQVITMQLGDRIEHLIDVSTPPPAPTPSTPATTRATTPAQPAAPSPAPAATPAVSQEQATQQVANALGEAALLLNTVNVQGFRGFTMTGRPGGPGRDPGCRRRNGPRRRTRWQSARRADAPSATIRHDWRLRRAGAARPGEPEQARDGACDQRRRQPGVTPPGAPGAPTTLVVLPPSTTGGRGANANAASATGADSRTVVTTENGMKIDLSQIRRDIYRQILPSQSAESLTPEERRRVASEVNQRMLGIAEGIKLSAAEIRAEGQGNAAARRRDGEEVVIERLRQHEQVRRGRQDTGAGRARRSRRAAATGRGCSACRTSRAAAGRVDADDRGDDEDAGDADDGGHSGAGPAADAAETHGRVQRQPARHQVRTRRSGRAHGQRRDQPAEHVDDRVFLDAARAGRGAVCRRQGRQGLRADATRTRNASRTSDAIATPTGPLGKQIVREWVVVTTAGPAGSGLRFGIARSTGDSLAALRHSAGRNALFGLLFIGVALVGVVPLSSRLTRNLSKLTEGVARISRGDYRGARRDARRTTRSRHSRRRSISMAADVEKHQRSAVEQERIRRELELGRQIQHDMLPHGSLQLRPHRDQRHVGAGARGRRRLLQLLPARQRPHRDAGRRRVGQGRRRGAAHGEHPGVAPHAPRARPGSGGRRRRDRSRHRSELAAIALRDAVRRHARSRHARAAST